MASASCSFFLADILLGMVEQQQPTTVSRDSNHTVSNSKPAELLQQTTRGFQAAGIVREYPDRGNSPHTRYQFAWYYSTKQDATFLWLNSRKKVHARCYVRAPLSCLLLNCVLVKAVFMPIPFLHYYRCRLL